jgi:NAD(P)-dependent dehydrogenase (short-subunit alcohol dehydrogenase family)
VLAVPADVSRAEDVDRFVSAALERWGRVDGLVNNAGTSAAAPFNDVSDEGWEADLQLKLFAVIRTCRLAHRALAASGSGSVVNVLNIGAKAPGPRSLPTSVSRAAGMALTKALSKEWGPEGIRVNAILIGLVVSGQWRRRAEAQSIPLPELTARMASDAKIPLGRMGRAEEFADLAAFLLSPRSAYITGTAINFDGGGSTVV